jgi:hypothetical protein
VYTRTAISHTTTLKFNAMGNSAEHRLLYL